MQYPGLLGIGGENRLIVKGMDSTFQIFDLEGKTLHQFGEPIELLMTIDRELPFPVEHKTVKETIEIGGQSRQIDRLKSTSVSRGIGIDRLRRIWVLAFIKEVPEIKEGDEFILQEFIDFEIYNSDGVFLCHVPLPEEIQNFDNFVMFENTAYFIDPYGECCVFEYKIVDD